ncbi:hypothetical protein GBAR_LOCUS1172, partial [Geodia barretti]
ALVSEPQHNLYTVFQVEILGLSLILSCRAVINAAYMKAGVLMILNPPGLKRERERWQLSRGKS